MFLELKIVICLIGNLINYVFKISKTLFLATPEDLRSCSLSNSYLPFDIQNDIPVKFFLLTRPYTSLKKTPIFDRLLMPVYENPPLQSTCFTFFDQF